VKTIWKGRVQGRPESSTPPKKKEGLGTQSTSAKEKDSTEEGRNTDLTYGTKAERTPNFAEGDQDLTTPKGNGFAGRVPMKSRGEASQEKNHRAEGGLERDLIPQKGVTKGSPHEKTRV